MRCEVPTRPIPVDRERLAALPGQPPPQAPLVCLDTETTGLATAAGTVAFLIGLGWWEGDRFRQVQLLLPDHADERALLTALAATIAPSAWLVTYNGRGFDWPLLVARYRLARRSAPLHDGHLDLLPIVRRLFRHRMDRRPAADRRGTAAGAPSRRRRRGLGDPGPVPALPAERLGGRARQRRPPQRPGRPLAGPAARSPRGSAGRSGTASRGRTRRPGRSRPGVRAGAPPRRSAGLSRRRRRPAEPMDRFRPWSSVRPSRPGPDDGSTRIPGGRRAGRPISAGCRGGCRNRSGRPGPRRSTLPGRPNESRSIGRTCCVASAGTSRRPASGIAGRRERAGPRSSQRSSWPSSRSIGCATGPRRSARSCGASRSSSDGAASDDPNRRSRPTCCGDWTGSSGSSASSGASSARSPAVGRLPRSRPARPDRRGGGNSAPERPRGRRRRAGPAVRSRARRQPRQTPDPGPGPAQASRLAARNDRRTDDRRQQRPKERVARPRRVVLPVGRQRLVPNVLRRTVPTGAQQPAAASPVGDHQVGAAMEQPAEIGEGASPAPGRAG